MNKPEINPYVPPKSSLVSEDVAIDPLDTRELYNKLLTFNGRMGRIRYLYTTIGGMTMALALSMVWSNLNPLLGVLAVIYYAVKMPWVCAASSVRRFHDLGKPGVWAWLALLPPIYIWLALVEGQDKANEYGNTVFQPTKWEYIGVFCTIALCTLPLMILSSYTRACCRFT